MRDAHEVYLNVVHKIMTIEEGMDKLEEVMAREPKFKPWVRVFVCSSSHLLVLALKACPFQHD